MKATKTSFASFIRSNALLLPAAIFAILAIQTSSAEETEQINPADLWAEGKQFFLSQLDERKILAYRVARLKERHRLDLLELEAEWMAEDIDEDDVPIDEDILSEIDKRKMEAMAKVQSLMDSNGDAIPEDLAKMAQEADDSNKAPMVFVKLASSFQQKRGGGPEGMSWDNLANICNEFMETLSFKVIDPTCYPIEPDSMMVSSKRPWEKKDIYNFFRNSEDIDELRMDGQTAYPAERVRSFNKPSQIFDTDQLLRDFEKEDEKYRARRL